MAPTKQKQERKYVPPAFIDEKLIKTLSPDKQEYWANRILGNPGQGKKTKSKVTPTDGGVTRFDNEGNMMITNRAARRKKPTTPSHYTKSTHSQKKLRGQIK